MNPESYKDQLQAENVGYFTANDVVVVETYYHHYQVLHAPLVEWVFPEPIILYVRTVMRIASPKIEE